jgi:hypothetical protein
LNKKAGTKISHVDALSRHVDAIMEDGFPDKERFLEEKTGTLSVIRENQETPPVRANIFWTKMASYISVEPIVDSLKKNGTLPAIRENQETPPVRANIFWTKMASYISVEPIVNTSWQ